MKQPNAITVAMIRDPQGATWQAQIQMEYKNSTAKDILRLSGDSPMTIMNRASKALEKKLSVMNGVTIQR